MQLGTLAILAVLGAGTSDVLGADAGAPSSAVMPLVVVRVAGFSASEEEIERRFARMIPFQLRTYGETPARVRHRYLERVLIPELVFAAEAEARGAASLPHVRLRLNRILATALTNHVRSTADADLTPAEIKRYFDESPRKEHESFEQFRDSYRITLRRKKAHAELTQLESELEKSVSYVEPKLAERLRVTEGGQVRWSN